METKKFVIDGLKFEYSGPFEVAEFYKAVDEWITKRGKEKETKKKAEHVHARGKSIEWFIEIWEHASHYSRAVVRMRALFSDVREANVKQGDKRKKLNTGNALIIFDGILEEEKMGKWQQKPLFYFLRALFDKFVWKFYTHKFEDELAADVNSLYEAVNDFFSKYKV